MIKIYISQYHDVYTNIAIERYLFEHAENDLILYLWQNSPCVVFGRNQNIYNEVNIEYANKHNINLIRRFSGGGAVYQDLGNLDYTFICNESSSMEELNNIIIKVFKNLGLDVAFSGRNDLLIKDHKFSGLAYCADFDHIMYHGTCLINTSLEELVNVLKPHDYKLKTHSVSSYKSRVINLKEVDDSINANKIIESFISVLKQVDDVNIIDDIKIVDGIKDIYDYLKNKDYIYNDCPSYSYPFDIRLNNSNYHFEIEYKDGLISDIKIYSDDLNITQKDIYYKALINKKIPLNSLLNYLKSLQ